jgi:outer membrane protein OmpA-like peptidoglycan-associated protein
MIEVHGFTDKVGDASYNKTLSAKRAEAVTEYLTANHNVPLYRIFDTGSGEFNAASVSGTPREVRDQSRRVDVKIFVAKL